MVDSVLPDKDLTMVFEDNYNDLITIEESKDEPGKYVVLINRDGLFTQEGDLKDNIFEAMQAKYTILQKMRSDDPLQLLTE